MLPSSTVVAVPGRFGSLTAFNSVGGTWKTILCFSKGLNGWKVPQSPQDKDITEEALFAAM